MKTLKERKEILRKIQSFASELSSTFTDEADCLDRIESLEAELRHLKLEREALIDSQLTWSLQNPDAFYLRELSTIGVGPITRQEAVRFVRRRAGLLEIEPTPVNDEKKEGSKRNIEIILDAARKLVLLLERPQPGLISWHMLVKERLKFLSEFYREDTVVS